MVIKYPIREVSFQAPGIWPKIIFTICSALTKPEIKGLDDGQVLNFTNFIVLDIT